MASPSNRGDIRPQAPPPPPRSGEGAVVHDKNFGSVGNVESCSGVIVYSAKGAVDTTLGRFGGAGLARGGDFG